MPRDRRSAVAAAVAATGGAAVAATRDRRSAITATASRRYSRGCEPAAGAKPPPRAPPPGPAPGAGWLANARARIRAGAKMYFPSWPLFIRRAAPKPAVGDPCSEHTTPHRPWQVAMPSSLVGTSPRRPPASTAAPSCPCSELRHAPSASPWISAPVGKEMEREMDVAGISLCSMAEREHSRGALVATASLHVRHADQNLGHVSHLGADRSSGWSPSSLEGREILLERRDPRPLRPFANQRVHPIASRAVAALGARPRARARSRGSPRLDSVPGSFVPSQTASDAGARGAPARPRACAPRSRLSTRR